MEQAVNPRAREDYARALSRLSKRELVARVKGGGWVIFPDPATWSRDELIADLVSRLPA